MAAGGRNPQKSAVARARAQDRAKQEGQGGGGASGQASRSFDQGAADAASAKREKTKALRAEREKKAAEQAAKDERAAAKAKKAEDAEAAAKKAAAKATSNETAEAPAPAEEECVCEALADLDLNEKYGHEWSMTEVKDDKITKKAVVDYIEANATDEFKAANGFPVSKNALKKTLKDQFVETYAKMLKECPK